MLTYVKDGKLEKIEGDPNFGYNQGRLCLRCLNMVENIYNNDRLKWPLLRDGEKGENKWKRITWEEAFDWLEDTYKTVSYTHLDVYKRQALARALVLEPEILLLDEPFSALDPATKERLYATLRAVHARFDCTIVFVTHDFNEARTLADRVGVVLDGRLRAVREACALFEPEGLEPEVQTFLGLRYPGSATSPSSSSRRPLR